MSVFSLSQGPILLVESDEESCSALTKMLEGHGYIVKCAATLDEAMAELARDPSHVIVDLMMPDNGGRAVLQFIRATMPRTRVAILSEWVNPLLTDHLKPDLIVRNKSEFVKLMDWLRDAYHPDIAPPGR
jgi:CheY-like chemotaxis protein